METKKIIRNYFRITVRETDRIKIMADGHQYPIVDVGDKGVGIRLTEEDIFLSVSDPLEIELDLQGKPLHLQGKIVHISPDGSGHYLCGIEFQKIDAKQRKKILAYLQQVKDTMFAS